MTSADQTGQFHTGSSDRPAAEPSVFQAMADTPAAGVQAEESVTQSLADAAKGGPEADPEAEGDEKKKAEEADNPVLEKARKTDADKVERLREEQQSTEPPDEKSAKAITKENEDIQLAAHAAYLDALEVAEKENVKVEKAQEAEAKKAEKGEAPASTTAKAEPEAKKAEAAKTVEAAKATEKAAAKTTAAAQKSEPKDEEVEEVDVEDLTVPELKDELDEAGVEYPSDARKADLVKLVKKTWK